MLTSQYENFKVREGETIHELFTKLSSITNELRSLGEPISMSKQVRKVLQSFPSLGKVRLMLLVKQKT